MGTQARELPNNPARQPKYRPPDPRRVRHDTLWHEMLRRWRPGRRVWIETQD